MADETQHLVVIGGGPAGAAAALRARQLDATVTVIDRAEFPRPRPCSGWLGPAAVTLLEQFGLTGKQAGATPFEGLTLHAWDLRSKHEIRDEELCGWLVRRETFDAALLNAAGKAGATLRTGQPITATEFGEDAVTFELADGTHVRGQVALLADGAQSETAAAAYIKPAGGIPGISQTAFAEFTAPKSAVGLDVAVAASRAGQIVTIARHAGHGRVSLMTREPEPDPVALLREFASAAAESGLLPELRPDTIDAGLSPAGLALDLDTHVGKRSLLIGDAGGFVGAFSNEGLYPGLRSGCLASEVALQALAGDRPQQDALQEFGPIWRHELAEYLRMPNTDLALLMPLVFKNEQMAQRVARAFLCGLSF